MSFWLLVYITLEEEMATHSSTLAPRFSWTEGPGGLQSKESDMTERLTLMLLNISSFMYVVADVRISFLFIAE